MIHKYKKTRKQLAVFLLVVMFIATVVVPVTVEAVSFLRSARAQFELLEGENSQTMDLLSAENHPETNNQNVETMIIENNSMVPSIGVSVGIARAKDVGIFQNDINEIILAEENVEMDSISRYTVKEGDTLSEVSELFAVSTTTIRLTNGLDSDATIRLGQTLEIPPVDGVPYTIKKGDTISQIASLFEVSSSEIIDYNYILDTKKLAAGEKIFIPGATKSPEESKEEKKASSSSATSGSSNSSNSSGSSSSSSARPTSSGVVSGKPFIEPVRGSITRKDSSSHRGWDVRASTGTPIYAMADGVVTVAKSSGYNGGFGQMVLIYHPDITSSGNTKTLYAHMSKVDVSVGEKVSQGEVIGYVGSTGRSTGPHLHFEVRVNDKPSTIPSYLY